MFTYLLQNKQGLYETTNSTFKTRRQADRDAKTWACNWLNLTGQYIVVPVKHIQKVENPY